MPRPLRLASETQIYHVMARGNRRTVIFHDNEDKKRFINIILNKKKEDSFRLFAYCIMDNHYHLLIKEENEELATIMKMINSSYATYYNDKYNGVGHVFQDRYRSEPVNNDEYLLGVTRYIHNNPKKAGIVNRLQDYAWSSYEQYIYYKQSNDLVDVSFILSLYADNISNSVKRFIDFNQTENTDIYLEDFCETEEETKVKEYIEQVTNENLIEAKELFNNKKYIKIRNNTILNIKAMTMLSNKQIAEIIGMSRYIINRI